MIIVEINHPKWLMEENAKIFRNEDWFKPPIAPTIIDVIIKKNKKFIL